ncbi:peptidoglycan-binding protein [Cereibacter sphaeroides]|uniref:peptidoglycan-binding protein n=1 Tax=Cereibacter sphaeroides TaxID=1063 RepID=UPI001F184F19|nr:peptidoglycan-binding protein [Cereibacter sphaeroides]MCE6950744.1 peptidoglycan-binding protein [Cereibacter sphaeroides]MCE6959764.1 peptidoglycan-binding protein [Cereibacter sphaeroides]MCE6968768.1 peptidoglycan-binding protein [Cereibacter sphaeroides]MCE6974618.1 peptidoglycan-binding protein [Cereibacter sphaeroides]
MTIDIRKTAIAALAALSLVPAAAAPAHALGKKDKAFIAGAATAVVAGAVINNMRNNGTWPFAAGQPRYAAPAQPQYYVQPRTTYSAAPQRVTYQPRYVAPSVHSTPAAQAFRELSPQMRREVQISLARYGYYSGSIDGAWGPGTSGALEAYARDSGRAGQLGTVSGAYGIMDGLSG